MNGQDTPHRFGPIVDYQFDISIFARPREMARTGNVTLRGMVLSMLDSAALTRGKMFSITFERASEALVELLRMDIEPDGYFVWSREEKGRRWQVDGHLFDRNDRLWRIDLRGSCPPPRFNELLTCFGWPQIPLVFQLVREGVTLGEEEFRRWA